ncbi:hypothetical protein DV737_g3821, partial [Chaetothyriales sp. CBS 132003]
MSSAVASLFPPSAVDAVARRASSPLSEAAMDKYSLLRPEARLPSPLPPPSGRPGLTRSLSSSSSSHQSSSTAFLSQTYLNDRRTPAVVVNEQFRTSLPGLASIAGLASATPPPTSQTPADGQVRAIQTPLQPVPTPGIAGNTPPVCQNCATSTTPLWRRDEAGSVLCNACGLFLKLHGRPRPISLKTDVIKSRNRVKSANQVPKKKVSGRPVSSADVGYTLTPTALPPGPNHRRVSQMAASVTSERSHSPVSRTNTPSLHHDPNIAPQHMFDGVTLNDGAHFAGSPSLPPLNLGQPSPSNVEGSVSYDQLVAANTSLRTRVSELEVINMVYSDNENSLRGERDKAIRERDELRQRVEQLEQQLTESQELARPSKKAKLSEEPRPSVE